MYEEEEQQNNNDDTADRGEMKGGRISIKSGREKGRYSVGE